MHNQHFSSSSMHEEANFSKAEDDTEVPLLTDTEDVIEQSIKTSSNRPFYIAICIYLAFLTIIYLSWTTPKSQSQSHAQPPSQCHTDPLPPPSSKIYTPEQTSCGNSIESAQARNCTFDPTGNNWVPQLCYNAKLASEAIHGPTKLANMFGLDELKFYLDRNMTQYVATDDLGAALATQVRNGGPFEAYVTEKWHVAHCLYLLRMGVEATHRVASGERDVWIHHTAVKAKHAAHCTKIVRDHRHREAGVSVVSFGYTHCERIA